MYYARNSEQALIAPTKEQNGFCPICKSELIPKLGAIIAHHWSHRAGDCDSWSEPESEWHLNWKLAGDWYTEVVIGNHRADIVVGTGDSKLVVEVQSSSISVEEARTREEFYGNMIWVFNLETRWPSTQIRRSRNNQIYLKGARLCNFLRHLKRPVYIDLDNGKIFHCHTISADGRLVFGKTYSRSNVIAELEAQTISTKLIYREWYRVFPSTYTGWVSEDYIIVDSCAHHVDKFLAGIYPWLDEEPYALAFAACHLLHTGSSMNQAMSIILAVNSDLAEGFVSKLVIAVRARHAPSRKVSTTCLEGLL